MNQISRPLFLVLAALWAIFCGGFAYDVTQQEKNRLYREYVGRYDPTRREAAQHIRLDDNTEAQRKIDLQNYDKELRELYWAFAPFFWICLTLSGYTVGAGFFLPIRWIYHGYKAD